MKLSYNWLKEYLDLNQSPEAIGDLLTDIGLEVEGMETVESVKGGLKGLVVGEVTFKDKHPDADKLSITKVNVGKEEELHIVCGAPNVAQGQKVIVATIGTMLYPIDGEPFKIKKGKIRGQVSEGMICAEDEIGLGHSHDGIMVLPKETTIGTPAASYFDLENDIVYEIGLTPNRSDATSHIGSAKDLLAALRIRNNDSQNIKMPSVDDFKINSTTENIQVKVENTESCPRYTGLLIEGVTVKESPSWLKNRLVSLGLTPKNNIVDITNFILHELGQPLHAFDADKIEGNTLIVKNLAEGTPFTTLDEIERKLSSEDLMICDGNSNPMCIGGVFGGIHSGVTENTRNIFLESAHFDAISIRKSSNRHLLRTDAAKTFEKGSDPNICIYALKRATLLIQELAGGSVNSDIIDIYPNIINKNKVAIRYQRINDLIGNDLSKNDVKDILNALEIKVVSENDTTLEVLIPTNKVDVTREADVIEEILRIYGVNRVELPTQIRSALTYAPQPEPFKIRNVVGDLLAYSGYNEIMGLSITESKYFKEMLPIDENKLVFINNTSNMHLDVMRPSMLFSGLEAIRHNQNRRNPDLKFFEFGASYIKEEKYIENQHLTLFLTGQAQAENWLNKDKEQVSFYHLKTKVQHVLKRLALSGFQESASDSAVLDWGLKWHRGPNSVVEFGKVKSKITKAMDIKRPVFYADFNWDLIMKALKKHKIQFAEINKFPSMRRDLALVVDKGVKFGEVETIAGKTAKKLLTSIDLFDVFEDENKLGKGKKSYAISLVFEDKEKTLNDKQIDKIMNQLIQQYEEKLGALIRK